MQMDRRKTFKNRSLACTALIAIGIAVSSSEVDLHTECGRLADKWLMPKLHSPAGRAWCDREQCLRKDCKRH